MKDQRLAFKLVTTREEVIVCLRKFCLISAIENPFLRYTGFTGDQLYEYIFKYYADAIEEDKSSVLVYDKVTNEIVHAQLNMKYGKY